MEIAPPSCETMSFVKTENSVLNRPKPCSRQSEVWVERATRPLCSATRRTLPSQKSEASHRPHRRPMRPTLES
jgi:hypothetical protein